MLSGVEGGDGCKIMLGRDCVCLCEACRGLGVGLMGADWARVCL
jgi:hypothetical protein